MNDPLRYPIKEFEYDKSGTHKKPNWTALSKSEIVAKYRDKYKRRSAVSNHYIT
jgi:hypothetical protein